WTPLNSINLFFMLEAIGFGYFVSLEVSFSTWFFYLLEKLFACAGLAAGYEIPGFPFMREQSAGAYIAVALLILWTSRRYLAGILRDLGKRKGGCGGQRGCGDEIPKGTSPLSPPISTSPFSSS